MLARAALGAVLHQQRTESSYSLRELSKISGVSIAHISEVERGIKECSSEVLQDLCDSLGITVPDLLISASERFYGAQVAAPE